MQAFRSLATRFRRSPFGRLRQFTRTRGEQLIKSLSCFTALMRARASKDAHVAITLLLSVLDRPLGSRDLRKIDSGPTVPMTAGAADALQQIEVW